MANNVTPQSARRRDMQGAGDTTNRWEIRARAHNEQVGQIDPANRERLVAYAKENLPRLVPDPYAETTCLFTMTPTGDFVLDRIENLTVVSPCSGHGAKFARLIGILAAELASAQRTPAQGRALMPREFPLDRISRSAIAGTLA